MLKIVSSIGATQNYYRLRFQPQTEEINAEALAGLMAGRGTTVQIFNLRILFENCLQHHQNMNRVFIHITMAFDRVWHEALRAHIIKYNLASP